ncbi:MAG TPA: hypothetical protein DCF68_11605 [Cyanothece sp. UBA12306]|nr:hypothetical protein [Cyanothece sp. UBA12306]
MNKDTKFALLVMGLPIAGMVYCGLIFAFFMNSPLAIEHPLMTGMIVVGVPLLMAVITWISASAKAYKKRGILFFSQNG